jgi:hypothetical protein
MKLPRLDPEIAYVGSSLWLPRKYLAEGAVRGALTFGADSESVRVLVEEHPHHLEVPREFVSIAEMRSDMGLTVVDLRPTSFPSISLRPKPSFMLREGQAAPWRALQTSRSGVFNLKCGGGKTVLGLRKAAETGQATLIVSPQWAHIANWKADLASLFDYGGEIGQIGDGKMDWEKGIVFSTVQTLAGRVENGELPSEFFRHFGLVIYDETHHMAAAYFVKAAAVGSGIRLGLTATVNRVDRLEGIYLAHLGDVLYSDTSEEMPCEMLVIKTGIDVPCAEDEKLIRDTTGQRHFGLIYKWLGQLPERNAILQKWIDIFLGEGRTIYALSHSRAHAELMHDWNYDSGLMVGGMKHEALIENLFGHPLVFGTVHKGAENYSRDDLDTLVLMTPMAARDYASPQFQQTRGRIQRPLEGKKTPRIIVFMDELKECQGIVHSLILEAKRLGFPVRIIS